MLLAQKSKFDDIRIDESTAMKYSHLQIPPGAPLSQVVNLAQNELAPAMEFLSAILEALSIQTTLVSCFSFSAPQNSCFRFPVLVAVDELQAIYRRSEYRDPHFIKIQSYHLAFPRILLEFASGMRSFERGAFLGSLSVDLKNPVPLELIESLDMVPAQPTTPYSPTPTAVRRIRAGSRTY